MSLFVRVTGVRSGVQIISLTKLLSNAGMGLSKALDSVNSELLEGRAIKVEVGSREQGKQLVSDLLAVGAHVELISDS